jgi:hypothetical protein
MHGFSGFPTLRASKRGDLRFFGIATDEDVFLHGIEAAGGEKLLYAILVLVCGHDLQPELWFLSIERVTIRWIASHHHVGIIEEVGRKKF